MAEALNQLGVKISEDGLDAVLTIPAGLDPQQLSASDCSARLAAEGIGLVPEDQQRMKKLLKAYGENPGEAQKLVIRGTPPRHGRDGRVVLLGDPPPPLDALTSADFDALARQPFRVVAEGEAVARMEPPDHGHEGRDLFGSVLPARPGRAAALQLDESVEKDATDTLYARRSGSLVWRGLRLGIYPLLSLASTADQPESGLLAEGDLHLAGGLEDGFFLDVQGNAAIGERVDAARLHVGLDLLLFGGMAGRDRGRIQVGRDCMARYLQQVDGQIRRDLWVEREVVGCRLGIGGRLIAPQARLVGGECHLLGGGRLRELGSSAGVRTVVHPGSAPLYVASLHRAELELQTLAASLATLEERMNQVRRGSRTMTAQAKEELTEWMCRKADLEERQARLQGLEQSLQAQYQHQRREQLQITDWLYPGVVLVYREIAYTLSEAVAGPVEIFARKRDLCFRRQGQGTVEPIRRVAQVASWKQPAPATAA